MTAHHLLGLLPALLLLLGPRALAQTLRPTLDITPVPKEKLNPRLSEFLRIDANADNQLTFSEFLLSDRPFVESQSRYFHELDGNNDGRVTRAEFEAYFRKHDENERQQRVQTDQFFRNLGSSPFELVQLVGPRFFGPAGQPPSTVPDQLQPAVGQQQQQSSSAVLVR